MKLVDLNLLLYAVNEDAPDHEAARAWWEDCLADDEPVGLAWPVVLGFLRLTTNPRVLPHPITPQQAIAVVDDWLARPVVRLVGPTDRHWGLLREALGTWGTAGNLTTDADLAVLAIEHGATLHSADNDFARFDGLRWVNPLRARGRRR